MTGMASAHDDRMAAGRHRHAGLACLRGPLFGRHLSRRFCALVTIRFYTPLDVPCEGPLQEALPGTGVHGAGRLAKRSRPRRPCEAQDVRE
jgi:hypothetical protein